MTREEAIKILDPETGREALLPYAYDQARRMAMITEAMRMGAEALNGGSWIPVTPDTMPPKFEPVFVCRDIGGGERKVEQGYKDFGDWWKVYGTRSKKVTHWMPLPEPPEDG